MSGYVEVFPAGPGRFATDPDIDLVPNSDHMQLKGDLVWQQDAGVTITAPSGMIYDGATVPRVLWPRLGHPLSAIARKASAIHDYECVTRRGRSKDAHDRLWHMLRASGMGWWRARLFWAGVRVAGPRW